MDGFLEFWSIIYYKIRYFYIGFLYFEKYFGGIVYIADSITSLVLDGYKKLPIIKNISFTYNRQYWSQHGYKHCKERNLIHMLNIDKKFKSDIDQSQLSMTLYFN